MKIKYALIGFLIALGIGYGTGRYLQPQEVKIQYKEVIKEVEVERKNVITIIKEIERPDGTKEKITKIVDKSTIEKDIEKKTNKVTTVKALKPQWKVAALVGIGISSPAVYGAQIERRIFGPFFLGVWGNTNKTMGISVSMEF